MKTQAITGNFQEANVDALAVTVFKDEKASSGVLKDFDKLTGGIVSSVIKHDHSRRSSAVSKRLYVRAR